MSDEPLPQADQLDGAPHPRETQMLIGQERAETDFLDAFKEARLHHAWLVTGPRGIGKATLAWRLARFLLATPAGDGGMFATAPPDTLDIADSHPVVARLQALSEPGLCLIRRIWDTDKKTFKAQITVDEVRRLKGFFALSTTDGGRRVVIVDAADDLNVNAANALLKLLEEPPKDTVILLVCHQPSNLLPTIRSRCRELRCRPLDAQDMATALTANGLPDDVDPDALSELAGGSVGEALALVHLEGLALYGSLLDLASGFPNMDRPKAIALGEAVAGRAAQARFDLMLRLTDTLLNRLARAGLGQISRNAVPHEIETLSRLSPDADAARQWAGIGAEIGARLRHGQAVNLDPAALVLDMVLRLNETAAKTSR